MVTLFSQEQYCALPSTTSTHFLRTLGIPFQFVDEPSEATEHGESRTGTGFDVEGVEDFLSCNSGIVPSTERIAEFKIWKRKL